jgi:membrane protease YdiL (CAAX protease family)
VKRKRLPLRTLLIVTYVLQVVAVFSIFLSDLYAPLQIVRQITFIILLMFVPGTFLLGFFRIRELDLTLAVAMIVGLSIFFIFACGLMLMLMGMITGTTGGGHWIEPVPDLPVLPEHHHTAVPVPRLPHGDLP